MKRARTLMTSAAVALIAGMGAVMAQQQPPSTAPAEKPAEKLAPPSSGKQPSAMPHQNEGAAPAARGEGSKGRSETTGQAPQERTNRASEQNKSEQEHGRREQNRTTGQAPREQNRSEDRAKTERNKTERNEQNRTTTGQAPREERTNRASEQNRSEQDRVRTERSEENRTTTGQGAAGTRTNINVNITPEKRTQIHEVIVKERNAPRVASVNFDLSVGTRVPRAVRFVALPASILAIEPAWRGYDYFMVGDRIIIVDPRSMEIVAVLDV